MDVKRLVELSKSNPEASKKAAEGFEERLRQREEQFFKESKKLQISSERINRMYDI